MKKTKTNAEDRKLLDRLTPDATLGRLLGVLATTYEMQPEFFETDFLPTLLGLGAWDDRNWSSRIALEKHLAELEAAAVLLDARPYRGRPRSLRVEVEPVCVEPGRILHAKVLIGVYEEAVRLIVGSANLTEPGYRRNREVAAVLMASARRPAEAGLISDALREMETLLSHWRMPSAEQLYKLAAERLSDWSTGAPETEQWFVWGGGDAPLWRKVVDRWPSEDRVHRITIVSPFWSEERAEGPIRTLVARLRDGGQLAPQAELRLLTEAAPDKQATYKPKLPETFREFDAGPIGVEAAAYAVDPRVPPEEVGMGDEFTGSRSLHAKVVLLEGVETSLACFGSANFTRRGWGFMPNPSQANIEAALIVRRSGDVRNVLRGLIPPTTGDPVSLNGAAGGRLVLPDPSPEEVAWPSSLREALLTPEERNPDRLQLLLLVNAEKIAGRWKIESIATDDDQPPATLFDVDERNETKTEYRVPLSDQALARLLRDQEVNVVWWECAEGRSFPINVDVSARTALPVSPGTGRPEEQHLIAYYQGRITWEDLFPDPEDGVPLGDHGNDPNEPGGVDTSRIQSYIVREFVEALKGITDDLKAAAQSPKACMRLALLGAVSPVALARRVLEAAESGQRTPTASGFQLVEILGCLKAAHRYPASRRFQNDWLKLVHEAATQVKGMLDKLQKQFPTDFSRAFRQYAKTVRQYHQR